MVKLLMPNLRRLNPDGEDVALINDVVGRNRLPHFIDDFELRLGYDNADEPAVWIVFHTRGNLPSKESEADEWVAEINVLTNALREQIIEGGASRFPYFRFEPSVFADKPDA